MSVIFMVPRDPNPEEILLQAIEVIASTGPTALLESVAAIVNSELSERGVSS